MSANQEQHPNAIKKSPPPWTGLRATVYIIPWWVTGSAANNLPSFAYSPLEAASSFAAPGEGCHPVGGLGTIQILRYTETPVGPYDELIIAPGEHQYLVEVWGQNGEKQARKQKNQRITRTYVSQKETCYNGRLNWNIPKHLARFEFEDAPQGTTIRVFPHDLDVKSDPSESVPSDRPFFQATFKTVPFVPGFPLSLSVAEYIGLDMRIAHPPLPTGKGSQGELPGTDMWCRVKPSMVSRKAHVGWMDMQQPDEAERIDGVGEHFWPGFKRWMIAVRMDDCHLDFPGEEYWEPIKPVEE